MKGKKLVLDETLERVTKFGSKLDNNRRLWTSLKFSSYDQLLNIPTTHLTPPPSCLNTLCSLGVRIIKGVNDGSGELSSWDLLGEKDIKLVVRSIPGLRKTVITPHEHPKAGPPPDESSVTLEVPGLRVHEVLLKCSTNGSSYV
jgi:hypothetical protein